MRRGALRLRARQDGIRRSAVLHPILDRRQRVELIRPDAAAAMLHPRHQEQPRGGLGLRHAMQGRRQFVIKLHRARRRDRRVAGAVIQDHLAVLLDERHQAHRVLRLARAKRLVQRRHQRIAHRAGPGIDIQVHHLLFRTHPHPVTQRLPSEGPPERGVARVVAPGRLGLPQVRRGRASAPGAGAARPGQVGDRPAGIQRMPMPVMQRRRVRLQHRALFRRQAVGPGPTMADQVNGLHRAARRVLHQPVRRAVNRVAPRGDNPVNHPQRVGRQIPGRRRQRRLLHGEPQQGGMVIHRRIARDDAVEIAGIALRLHHRHAPAGRAAVEIRMPRRSAVIRPDKMLAGHRHIVRRAVQEIDHLRLVALAVRPAQPARVGAVPGMPRVLHDHGIAFAQRRRPIDGIGRRGQRPGIAADSQEQEALPPVLWQLQGEMRRTRRRVVARGVHRALHRAMRRRLAGCRRGRRLGHVDAPHMQRIQCFRRTVRRRPRGGGGRQQAAHQHGDLHVCSPPAFSWMALCKSHLQPAA